MVGGADTAATGAAALGARAPGVPAATAPRVAPAFGAGVWIGGGGALGALAVQAASPTASTRVAALLASRGPSSLQPLVMVYPLYSLRCADACARHRSASGMVPAGATIGQRKTPPPTPAPVRRGGWGATL